MQFDQRMNGPWWMLRIGLGAAPFLAGLDKFFNLLTNWEAYLNPLAPRLLHVSPTFFMHAVGVIEMIVGLAVLTFWTRWAAYVAMVWLIAIAGNLLMMGRFFDVAVRDLLLAIAAYTLARMTEVREGSMALSHRAVSREPAKSAA